MHEPGEGLHLALDKAAAKRELCQPREPRQRPHVARDQCAGEAEFPDADQRVQALEVTCQTVVATQHDAGQMMLLRESRDDLERCADIIVTQVQCPQGLAVLVCDLHELAALRVAEADICKAQDRGVGYNCFEGLRILRLDDRVLIRPVGEMATFDHLVEATWLLWHSAVSLHGLEGEVHIVALMVPGGHQLRANVCGDIE
mmetsp:Transcript_112735/g.313679  ORF Transcript_112735/g.313679 Transcript_112735/m.313679 type:complete len:201 (+) Transcript_112735:440-1042(+)